MLRNKLLVFFSSFARQLEVWADQWMKVAVLATFASAENVSMKVSARQVILALYADYSTAHRAGHLYCSFPD